jgi:hypothetical protein
VQALAVPGQRSPDSGEESLKGVVAAPGLFVMLEDLDGGFYVVGFWRIR